MQASYSKSIHALFFILLVTAYSWAASRDNQAEEGGLFFVFNQTGYAPGDTAYFAGYLLKAKGQITGKQMVSIKLFGHDKELIHHGRVLFENGTGISQLIIPQDTRPGNYQFISYLESSTFTKRPVFYSSYISISDKNIVPAVDLNTIQRGGETFGLSIITDHDVYGNRRKVSVSVAPGINVAESSITSLSVAVYNEQLFRDSADRKFVSTVKTTSIIPDTGKVKSNSGSPDFPYYFIGRALIKTSGKAVPDSSKITFYLNESDFAFVVYTRSGGNFVFPLIRNFGNEEIFYRIVHKGKLLKDTKIMLHDAKPDAEAIDSRRSDTLNAYGLYARQKQIINKSYHYFATKERKRDTENMFVSDAEADDEILLEKFEPFESMEEVFMNIVPSVRFKKSTDVSRIQVFLQRTSKYGINDPLYIVDGLMADDTQHILGLDPKIVNKIGVLRSMKTLSRFGDLGLDGILYIETDLLDNRESIINSANSLSVVGISKEAEYKKIVYPENKLNSRTPDLRSSLYWNPRANWSTIKSFDFYTSDDIGYYIIQIAGLVDGKPFLSTKRFYVTHHVNE